MIVDIETASGGEPTQTLAPFLPSIKGGRSKNPMEQVREAEENRKKAISKHLLSPVSAKILCMGILIEKTSYDDYDELEQTDTKNHFLYGDEKKILQDFTALIKPNTFFVTFNGRGFDFKFLMFRAAIHKINLSLPTYPYNGRDGHFDLMVHLNEISNLSMLYDYWKLIGLKKWIDYFGLPDPKPSIGKGEINLERLAADGEWKAIEEYQMGDVRNTYALWNIFKYNVKWSDKN